MTPARAASTGPATPFTWAGMPATFSSTKPIRSLPRPNLTEETEMKGQKFDSTVVRRRTFLKGAAAFGGAAALRVPHAFAQEPAKPAEIIVRAWGGSWVDSLKAGVSDPFTAKTGVAVRHDLTEDNEIQPKVWAAVAQNRVPPIHINWDTTTNATKSALRRVTEDLSDLPN